MKSVEELNKNSIKNKGNIIYIKPGEACFIREYPFRDETYRRSYGRLRIVCDENNANNICVRVLSTRYRFPFTYNYEELWEETDVTGIAEQTAEGQFSGVVNYTEIDVLVDNMEINNEYFMLTGYKRNENEVNNKTEYPKPISKKLGSGKNYFFGNYGVIYNVKFKNLKSHKLLIYPFGHNVANYADLLLNFNKNGDINSWKETTPIKRMNLDYEQYQIYNEIKKKTNNSYYGERYANKIIGEKVKNETSSVVQVISNNKWIDTKLIYNLKYDGFRFLLPG